jgi:glycosyltransferase involved in cell wall biosynthesis
MLEAAYDGRSKILDAGADSAKGGVVAPLKIVHIATRFLTAGSEENTTLSCNWFAERGNEVVLIVGSEVSDVAISRLDDAIRVIRVPSIKRKIHPVYDCQALLKLVSLLRQLKPEIIHTHQSKAGILGRLASLAVPDAVMVHGIHILPFTNVGWFKGVIYASLERSVAGLTDAFVSVSASLQNEALSKGIGKPEEHFVVPSGMQLSRFSHKRNQRHAQLRLAERVGVNLGERRVVTYVASYEPRKKHLDLIDALAKNRHRFERFCFLFAGGGVLEPDIRNSIKQNGLSEIVIPLGYVDDVEEVIAAADLTMFCSEREGLPRALVQYCSSGKPIVAFALPGIDAVLFDGQNGFICAQNDFAAMLGRIEQLALDPHLCQKMAASSAGRNLSNWNVDSMCEQLSNVYQASMKRKVGLHNVTRATN